MGGMRVNDRQMKQAMKKMGIKQSSIDGVTEVVIRTKDKELVVKNADVICIEMGGSVSYQVSGVTEERAIGADGVAKSCPRSTATGRRPSPPWRPPTVSPQRPSSR